MNASRKTKIAKVMFSTESATCYFCVLIDAVIIVVNLVNIILVHTIM